MRCRAIRRIGLRLPLASLPDVLPEDVEPDVAGRSVRAARRASRRGSARDAPGEARRDAGSVAPKDVIKTALCVEVRNGHLHVFMPPLMRLEDYVELLARVEARRREMQAAGRDRGLHAAARSARRAFSTSRRIPA